jgi:hypothetical protein
MAHGHSDAVLSPLRTLPEGGSMAGMPDGQLLERFASNQDTRAEAAFAHCWPGTDRTCSASAAICSPTNTPRRPRRRHLHRGGARTGTRI